MRTIAVFGLYLVSACGGSDVQSSSGAGTLNEEVPDLPGALVAATPGVSDAGTHAAHAADHAAATHDAALGAGPPSGAGSASTLQDPATASSGPLTYYRDIKPILDAKCAQCHVAGGMGPFPLTNYDEVRPLASAIRAAVDAGVMPPWRAAGPLDKYVGDRRLSDAQKSSIEAWIEQGAASGDPSQEPAHAPAEPRGLPRVDTVLEIAEPYTPPERSDDYRCFVLDWPYQDTRYITGLSVEPERREMVHHAVVYAVDALQSLEARARDAADAGPGYGCFAVDVAGGGWLTSYEPGGYGQANPGGVGFKMEPGSALILQIHYNTLHGSGTDASRLELMVDQTVSRVGQISLLYNALWAVGFMSIPAGANDVVHRWQGRPRELSSFAAYDLFAVDLHMHMLGRSGSIGIKRAGQLFPEPLLDIPAWAFEWQETYRLQEPVRLNSGDELYVECHFDNTKGHQGHGSDGQSLPVRDVNWGEGSTDEMCIGNVLATPAQD